MLSVLRTVLAETMLILEASRSIASGPEKGAPDTFILARSTSSHSILYISTLR